MFKVASSNKTFGKTFSRDIYEIFSDAFSQGRHDDRRNLMTPWASRGAASTIIEAYFDNQLEQHVPYDEFEDYRASLCYRLIMYSHEEMDRILKESRKIADSLEFEFLPYFELR